MTEQLVDPLARLDRGLTGDLNAEQRRLLELRLRRARPAEPATAPLSFTQEQLWFLDRLEPGNAAYNVPFGLVITGPLDREALHRAATMVVDRHPALRTTFSDRDGVLRQHVAQRVEVQIAFDDLTTLPPADRDPAAARIATGHAANAFDLTTGPLLVMRLLALAAERHQLLVTAHHIVFDAASADLFARDLAGCYGRCAGGDSVPTGLPELTISFARHAAQERERLAGSTLAGHLDYWRARLAGSPKQSTLPPDRPRPAVQTHRGGRRHFTVGAAATHALAARARQCGVTLNAVVVSAFGALLWHPTGQERVLLGVPAAGRSRTELEPVVGSFAGMLVTRVDLSAADRLTDLVRRTHRSISEAYAHQDAPYAKVVEAVDPPRDASHNPLFQVVLSLADGAAARREAAGVTFEPVPVDSGRTDFDLFVALTRQDDLLHGAVLQGELAYNADLYDAGTVDRLAERFLAVLDEIAADPDRAVRDVAPLARHEVAVAASFTAGPLLPPLELLAGVLRLPVTVRSAPYHQVVQHLLTEAGDRLADIVLLRWEDWLRHAGDQDPFHTVLPDLEAAVTAHAASTPLIIVVCPPSPGYAQPRWAATFGRLDDRLAVLAGRLPGIRALWFTDHTDRLPVYRVHDEAGDRIGHVPYTPEMFAAIAALVAQEIGRLLAGSPPAPPALPRALARPAAIAEWAAASNRPDAATGVPVVAPRDPTEERISGLWRLVLGVDEVGVTQNFFTLGGHSLLATRLLSLVQEEFGIEVSLHELFTNPTVETLAGLIRRGGEPTATIAPVPRGGELPASSTQQRLWALGQLSDDPTAHNTTFAAAVRGELDTAALRAALLAVVARHEILRTTFVERDGLPMMVVHEPDEAAPCWLPELDLTDEADAERKVSLRQALRSHARHRYDLEAGPLLRARLVRTGADEHYLLLGMHHIICDNTSWGVLLTELSAAYSAAVGAGGPEPVPLPVQFADFAAWQNELLVAPDLREHLAYWTRQLHGAPAVLELPGDRARPDTPSRRSGRAAGRVPQGVCQAVRALARTESVTPFAVLLAAYAVLLHRRSATDDLVIGIPHSGRSRPELAGLIGCFTDLLPVRIGLAGGPDFRALVRHVHETVVAGYRHQDAPFARIVDALRRPRDGRHPVFQCVFNLLELPDQALHWPRLRLRPVDVPASGTDFDLFLSLAWDGAELEVVLDHSADLFTARGANELVGEFVGLLDALVERPGEPIGAPAGVERAGGLPVHVAATFPAADSVPVVRWWAARLGLPVDVRPAPAGQLLRPLLDPELGFGAGCDVLLLRWADVVPGVATVGEFEDRFVELREALAAYHECASGTLDIVVCPPVRPPAAPWPAIHANTTDRLRAFCSGYARISVHEATAWARRYAAEDGWHEPAASTVLGTVIARIAHAHAHRPIDTVVLDPSRLPWPDALARFARAQTAAGRRVVLTAPAPERVLALSGAKLAPAGITEFLATADAARCAVLGPDPGGVAGTTVALGLRVADERALEHLWVLDAAAAVTGSHRTDPGLLNAIATELTTARAVREAITTASSARRVRTPPAVPPRDEREHAMAAIWCDLLRLPAVGVHDDFFDLGGDSMAAMQAVSLAARAGLTITPRQFAATPTIAQLCAADVAPATVAAEQGVVRGDLPATPAQLWFLETLAPSMSSPAHFAHPYYLELRRPLDPALLAAAAGELARHHDVLRLRFQRSRNRWRATHAEPTGSVPFETHDLSTAPAGSRQRLLDEIVADRLAAMDLRDGPLARFVHLVPGDGRRDRLLIICHHLVTDGVSRNLLLEDLQALCRQLLAGERPALPAKTTSYREWAGRLAGYAASERAAAQLPFWLRQRPGDEALPVDLPGQSTFGTLETIGTTLPANVTARLRESARELRVGLGELLVWASVRLAAELTGSREWTISTTGHGREALFDDVDLSRTLGWFQVLYPVRLRLPGDAGAGPASELATIAAQLRAVPQGGIGYAALRFAHPDAAVRRRLQAPAPQLTVNYMGAFGFDDVSCADELFDLCREEIGPVQDPSGRWPSRLDVVGSLAGHELRIELNFGTRVYRPGTAERLLAELVEQLLRLARTTRKVD